MQANVTFRPEGATPFTGTHLVEFKGGIDKKKNADSALASLASKLGTSLEELQKQPTQIEFLKAPPQKKGKAKSYPGKKKNKGKKLEGKTAERKRKAKINPLIDQYTLNPDRVAPPMPTELKPGTAWIRRNTYGPISIQMTPEFHPNATGAILTENEAKMYGPLCWDVVTASGLVQLETLNPTTPKTE